MDVQSHRQIGESRGIKTVQIITGRVRRRDHLGYYLGGVLTTRCKIKSQ